MGVGADIAKAEGFRTFAKEVFTFLEWLAISAAIQWAALKTASLALAILSFGLQVIAVIYVTLTGAIYLRSPVQRIRMGILRWLLAVPLVLSLLFVGNWLVTNTVSALLSTQISGSSQR